MKLIVFTGFSLVLSINILIAQSNSDLLKSYKTGFIENKGQIIDQDNNPNTAVLYLLNTLGFNVQLRRCGWSYDVYDLSHGKLGKRQEEKILISELKVQNKEERSAIFKFHRIDLDLIGSNPNCEIINSKPSPDYLNYYTTGTPAEGITDVKSYQKVTYLNIYPGIDLEFLVHENHGFEYNFLVHPGGNLANIQFEILGSMNIKEITEGLRFKTSFGFIDEIIPLCSYRMNDNSTMVKGHFIRKGDNIYGIGLFERIPEYAELIIDPVPTRRWGTYYGGNSIAMAIIKSCSVDGEDNSFIAGQTGSTDNIATAGAYQTILSGNGDAFLVKFSPEGQRLWGTYFGGSGNEYAYSCTTDNDDNIIIVGPTGSPDNIASPGAYQTNIHGTGDGFIAKFNSDGQRIWSTYYGGNEQTGNWEMDNLESCAVDNTGNIYCAGITNAPDYIASPGAHQTTFSGMRDNYLVKFSPDGQRLWGTYYGGSNLDQNPYCTASKNGTVFLTGNTSSPNNIATPGSFLPTLSATGQGFLAAFSTDGQRLWGTYYAGTGSDILYGCVADTGTDVYVYGIGSSLNIGTPGVFLPAPINYAGACLSKFSISGAYQWGTFYGDNNDRIYGAAIDDSGYIFVAGKAYSQNPGIPSPNAYKTQYGGGWADAFLAKLTGDGQRVWGTYYGGTDGEEWASCAVDGSDNVYLSGNTYSTNFSGNDPYCTRSPYANQIATPGSFQQELLAWYSIFLVKFADCYSPDTALQIYGPSSLCQNTTGVVFSIDPLPSVVDYNWCVTDNLTITSGQGTTSITVDVGSILSYDTISVFGINACDTGFPKIIIRRINQRPVPTITGPDTTCTGAFITYSTDPGNNGYVWSISAGGTIVGGGTTTDSTCTVSWSAGGSQWIQVNYTDTNGCDGFVPAHYDIWVIEGPLVSINIATPENPVCLGTFVEFAATAINGGSAPVYQWNVNGTEVGSNQPTFGFMPTDGDSVTCMLTSNLECSMNNPATSNEIIMTVYPDLPVIISISTTNNPVCEGSTATFAATTSSKGTSPSFQWVVNGNPIGTNDSIFAYSPSNGDQVYCILTSSEQCTTNNPATSGIITMIVNPLLTVGLSISASTNPICGGLSVTFLGTPINGGTSPVFQWTVNGIPVGTNSPLFSYIPIDGDIVACTLTSSEECVTNNPASSNLITMSVGEAPTVVFPVCFDTITTLNAQPLKLKGGIPLGGTYSGPGVNQITGYFNPAMAGVGLKTISYSYTNQYNCSNNATRTITVINPAPLTCGDSLTDIRDNKKYPTIQIGSQCWLAVNLNHGQQIGGSSAQRDNCLVEKYCYNNLMANCNQYGALYQWDELMRYEDVEEIQGICPPGWHVPSEVDWNQLFTVYQGNAFAGSPLLYTGYSGFNVLLAGVEFFNQSHSFAGFASIMWSSTSHGPYKAWSHGLNEYNYSVSYYPSYRANAFSVRCVRE